jgi:hypothetical protein
VDEHPEMSNEQIPATVRMRLMSGFIDHSRLEPVQFSQLGANASLVNSILSANLIWYG